MKGKMVSHQRHQGGVFSHIATAFKGEELADELYSSGMWETTTGGSVLVHSHIYLPSQESESEIRGCLKYNTLASHSQRSVRVPKLSQTKYAASVQRLVGRGHIL